MPTIKNLSSGEVIPQMGFAPTQSQNGGWTATRRYYMLATTWEGATVQNRFARGTPISTADPGIASIYSFLTVESKVANYEDSGTVQLTVTYTGSPDGQYGGEGGGDLTLAALPIYRLDGRLRDLSFSLHPKFAALSTGERSLLGELINGNIERSPEDATKAGKWLDSINFADYTHPSVWPDPVTLTADGLEFADRIAEGSSTYQAPTLVWTEITEGNIGMTPSQLGKLGEISTPRGNPPTIPGYNWMLTSASQQQQGDLFQTTLEWTLSPPDGWDSFLYTLT